MTDQSDRPANQYGSIPRDLLSKYFGNDPRLVSAFEDQSIAVQSAFDATTGTVSATSALQNATVVTLSTNDVFNNEFVLTAGDGTKLGIAEGSVKVDVDDSVARTNNQKVQFFATGPSTFTLPLGGELVSDVSPVVMYNKTLEQPKMTGLIDADNDADAAAAGVPLWGVYRDFNNLCIRVT